MFALSIERSFDVIILKLHKKYVVDNCIKRSFMSLFSSYIRNTLLVTALRAKVHVIILKLNKKYVIDMCM